ncbi:hypothetical protein BJ912DRAFT_1148248 [Pholiota molesta]|nr:hypothetical protein BJ912DRAFT_1148248 [Pholiota molesta]
MLAMTGGQTSQRPTLRVVPDPSAADGQSASGDPHNMGPLPLTVQEGDKPSLAAQRNPRGQGDDIVSRFSSRSCGKTICAWYMWILGRILQILSGLHTLPRDVPERAEPPEHSASIPLDGRPPMAPSVLLLEPPSPFVDLGTPVWLACENGLGPLFVSKTTWRRMLRVLMHSGAGHRRWRVAQIDADNSMNNKDEEDLYLMAHPRRTVPTWRRTSTVSCRRRLLAIHTGAGVDRQRSANPTRVRDPAGRSRAHGTPSALLLTWTFRDRRADYGHCLVGTAIMLAAGVAYWAAWTPWRVFRYELVPRKEEVLEDGMVVDDFPRWKIK